tara:strand:- start:93 stop:311 length:219 start_codon:yes stop_codon:yes gene_type:complete
MFTTVVLIQMLAVSVGGYVNFALEEPCPEEFYGTSKCYTYTYSTNNSSNRHIKRVYIKKVWENFEDVSDDKK